MAFDLYFTSERSPAEKAYIAGQISKAIQGAVIRTCSCDRLKIAIDGTQDRFTAYINCHCGQQQGKSFQYDSNQDHHHP